MKKDLNKVKVGIVGAGLTGLIAAKVLSEKGVQVSVFEKIEGPGGRMRTENIDGWKLDVGFQVLLTSYPYLKKHVELSKLNLITLDAAATIFREGKTTVVGDPFRVKNILFKTAFSDIGSIKDKWLIFQLKRFVDKHSIDEVFEMENETTIDFLESFGFSRTIIHRFFKPFFGGIFLENELSTSSRKFLFVFKMFSEGNAAIPKSGIGAVARYLEAQLIKVSFSYNSEVSKVAQQTIHFENGSSESFDYVINTIPNFENRKDETQWQGCYNLYFEHPSPAKIKQARIGLNANENRLINNVFYPSIHQDIMDKKGKSLISVTVLDSKGFNEKELIEKVQEELRADFGIQGEKLIKLYHIPYSLPKNTAPVNKVTFDDSAKTFEVGDFILNGSQNAACKAGEKVAKHILKMEKI